MFPFPDYYAQLGLILKNTPYAARVPLRYHVNEETVAIVVIMLVLGIELWISLVQIIVHSIRTKRTLSNADFLRAVYRTQTETSSTIVRAQSSIDEISSDETVHLLNTSSKQIIGKELMFNIDTP